MYRDIGLNKENPCEMLCVACCVGRSLHGACGKKSHLCVLRSMPLTKHRVMLYGETFEVSQAFNAACCTRKHHRFFVVNLAYIELCSPIELMLVFALRGVFVLRACMLIYRPLVHSSVRVESTRYPGCTHSTFSFLVLSASFECRRGEWRGMSLPSDANIETVTYGGLVNSACHGTGKTQARRCCCPRCKPQVLIYDMQKSVVAAAASTSGIAVVWADSFLWCWGILRPREHRR